jgi:hypothetical protein
MNIKEHIEAGHYPVDGKGRPLVPMRNGAEATIYALDYEGFYCLAGKYFIADRRPLLATWGKNGNAGCSGESSNDLLPPPPRKVPVKGWTLISRKGWTGGALHDTRECAEKSLASARADNPDTAYCGVVEMTGEHEMPWEAA